MSNFGIIVDGYSTGAGFAKEFLKHNILCIHIQSQPTIPKVYSHTYNPNDYYAHYTLEGDLLSLVQKLRQYKPQFVIAGAECGVELADQLSEQLHLPGNGTSLSAHRRNKYLMQNELKSKGLQFIPSFQATTLNEVQTWALAQKQWPLVVKPLTSAGGENVKICNTITEVLIAFREIMSTKINMLGFMNQAVIIQHYIRGEEYVVNTVSYGGIHKFCELWRYTRYVRSDGQQIYDTARVINVETKAHKEVINYAMKVLDVLGIHYGPAHVEIIKNEIGCFLIELGARLMGANLPFSVLAQCVTTPQALFAVMAYTSPAQFKEKISLLYRVIQPLVALFMVSNRIGTIKTINFLDKIRALESFYDIKLAVKVGNKLKKTIDYQTSPGMIYLSHTDPSVIEADILFIRTLENDMFQLEKEYSYEPKRSVAL